MASPERLLGWDELPDEILLHILSFLEPADIARLQPVSRKSRKLCLDNELWKRHCFHSSTWYRSLQRRRINLASASSSLASLDPTTTPTTTTTTTTTTTNPESAAAVTIPSTHSNGAVGGGDDHHDNNVDNDNDDHGDNHHQHHHHYYDDDDAAATKIAPSEPAMPPRWRELQDLANWDPSFPGERVSWYDEYIQRCVPPSVNWLETPRIRDRECAAIIEARGVDLYHPYGGGDGLGTMLAVSPLDDGSVCLWDVNGTRTRAGAVLVRSRQDILFADGPGSQNLRRSKRVDTGVTECVRVDNYAHRAYFAVQSNLFEIDLERLDVVSRETFEWSISTLSPISPGVPLTVGTSLGIHLHDFRARARPRTRDAVERVDGPGSGPGSASRSGSGSSEEANPFWAIFDPRPLPPYAPLSQPTPLSIVHLPEPGPYGLVSHDIYVSGRFTSILHYDRRKFPNIAGSIHSGATVNSMVALPHPLSLLDNELRRSGELTAEQVGRSKAASHGRTLIAGGIYKSKGSLEMYGLSPGQGESAHGEVMQQDSALKNRSTAASSSILSVANHGTKIVFSDGSGQLRWFERDGTTEIGSLAIGSCGADKGSSSLFASLYASAGELARKVVSTRGRRGAGEERSSKAHLYHVDNDDTGNKNNDDNNNDDENDDDDDRDDRDDINNDNVLFWTGERLGMVTFTPRPRFRSEDFEAADDGDEDGREYADQMRGALEQQADEARFMNRFGGA
ncbi:hypothetical protein ESCO_000326 [Escovopsis weberi]|uniref:F-box domain-containing protein n=1 Tax=Escovopsis weberi TaxID=150374 RepID=A0A0M8MZ51_ESCWE|nr:hypothetical protein ESCO_000326 [Escovopsis weberi]